MTKRALTILLICLASPVWALSCMRPDAVFLYETVRDNDASYYIVKGKVTLTEPANRPEPSEDRSPPTLTQAQATGNALSRSGFKAPFDRPIVIEATCLSIWCGDPGGLDQDTYIFALKIDGDRLTLRRGPCGGLIVPWTEEQEKRLLACHLDGKCERPDF